MVSCLGESSDCDHSCVSSCSTHCTSPIPAVEDCGVSSDFDVLVEVKVDHVMHPLIV